ncbi:MAG: hypothetical protein AUH34_01005 [Gemmatimonadetes bacterium 13_1_40CM_70_12]|nr:MAG: hypothetical protein AUH34_01005 [Gemmatimonadetes bacterium 13_1_40CM_70_12]
MLVGRWYTPITLKGRPPTLISRLTGSSGPNRRSTVRCSTMIAGAPVRSSAGVNTRPREMPPPRISMKRSSAPNSARVWVRMPPYSNRWNSCVQIAA